MAFDVAPRLNGMRVPMRVCTPTVWGEFTFSMNTP